MKNYRGSKQRLIILLTTFAMLVYNFMYGDNTVMLLSVFLAPTLIASMYDYWRNI
jgi:hypothetical protein